MSGGLWLPLVCAALYLLGLAGFAELVERREFLSRLARHPASYGLALGVYATTWSFYGGVGFAVRQGYVFLAVHLGVVVSCSAIPVLWRPLASLVRRQRFQSVADLLAFRFQSQAVGVLVTTFLVLASLPYLSLQLRAMVETGAQLAPDRSPRWLGLIYAGLLSLFAAGLGARWAEASGSGGGRRAGLLMTLALESVVKCVILIVVGLVALLRVFEGPAGLDAWLRAHPEVLADLFAPVHESGWLAIGFAAFMAAFLLPRQFHVAFVERPTDRALRHATWILPTLLLALNLPLPVLYWAGLATAPTGLRPDLWIAEFAGRHGLGVVVFLGGVSAASAMSVIACVALSGMIVNHIVQPLVGQRRILERHTSVRRTVIVALVFAGFFLHLWSPPSSLVDLGLVSFAAVAQLAPGVLATLLWPRATRRGLVVGLCAGILVWAALAFGPMIGGGAGASSADGFAGALWLSLLANIAGFALGSLSERPRAAEQAAAAACARREPAGVRAPVFVDVAELRERLAEALDAMLADAELERALVELGLEADEQRPLRLRELAETVERNLAERVGPLAARALVSGRDADVGTQLAAELRFFELRGARMSGSRRERALELVRRYLSRVLADMPLAVCSVDGEGEIVVWNRALAELTRLGGASVIGGRLADLPEPWAALFCAAVATTGQQEHRITRPGAGPRIVRLSSMRLAEADASEQVGAVLTVEDLSERRALLAELGHRDRLSSIGRLSAGIAHEVLNPLMGIMMIARNVSRELERGSDPAELELPARLAMVVGEGERIERIVRSLLTFSRGHTHGHELELSREQVEVAGVVDDAINLARLARRARRLDFVAELEPGLVIFADRHRLLQVLVNLLTNAVDASPEAAQVVVVRATRPEAGGVEIEVLDEGCGIDPALVDRVFEPFFTTKEPGEGTGLGLAVSYRIVAEHGGALRWRRRAPRGTTFTLTLSDGAKFEGDAR